MLKRMLALVLTGIMFTGSMTVCAEGSPILALGADLTDAQKEVVYSEMGISKEEADACETIYITNEMEHTYLDASIGEKLIGNVSLSSVLLIPQEKGEGLSIEIHNINYCTEDMYRNALLTAGVQDAKVIVAAPSSSSGTAALLGAVKAYEKSSGDKVDEATIEIATDELVLTGELQNEIQNLSGEDISTLIAFLKQEVIKQGMNDPVKLEKAVRSAAKEMDMTLTDEQVARIVSLLLKVEKLDISVEKMSGQAKELYEKLDKLGIRLDDEKVGNFVTRMVQSIWKLIQEFLAQ